MGEFGRAALQRLGVNHHLYVVGAREVPDSERFDHQLITKLVGNQFLVGDDRRLWRTDAESLCDAELQQLVLDEEQSLDCCQPMHARLAGEADEQRAPRGANRSFLGRPLRSSSPMRRCQPPDPAFARLAKVDDVVVDLGPRIDDAVGASFELRGIDDRCARGALVELFSNDGSDVLIGNVADDQRLRQ